MAASLIVCITLVLVARNADRQDRVSARRRGALAGGGGIVGLVVSAVIATLLSVVVGAGMNCVARLRCACTEHAGMDWGSCVSFVVQRMAIGLCNGYIRVVSGRVEGLIGNGCWMNAC